MGKLTGRVQDLSVIKAKLAKADGIQSGDLDELMDNRFDNVSNRLSGTINRLSDQLSGAISRLFEESDKHQSKALSDAIKGLVKAVEDRNDAFDKGLAHISQEFALSHNIMGDKINGVGDSNQGTTAQLQALQKSIGQLPTQFPKGEKVDLSEVMTGIRFLADQKAPDIGPQLVKLEKRLNKRIYRFQIERDPFNDLISEIVVTEK